MPMTFAELVQLGAKKESETESFYLSWADRLVNPGAKVLLSELAEEEAKHREFFENLEQGAFQQGQTPAVLDLHIADYLLDRELREDSDIQDVLIHAIHRETTAIKFFTDLAGQSGPMRSTFERMVAEESKHKLRLETFYDDNILTED